MATRNPVSEQKKQMEKLSEKRMNGMPVLIISIHTVTIYCGHKIL